MHFGSINVREGEAVVNMQTLHVQFNIYQRFFCLWWGGECIFTMAEVDCRVNIQVVRVRYIAPEWIFHT